MLKVTFFQNCIIFPFNLVYWLEKENCLLPLTVISSSFDEIDNTTL